jgi:glucokinase
MVFPHPLLVGDIGGTNARFAVAPAPGAPLSPVVRLRTADFATLPAAMAHLLSGFAVPPRSVILCGAGPLIAGRLKLTNAPWVLDAPALAAAGFEAGLILNDFEAQALALPAIPAQWLQPIGPDRGAVSGPRVILGPGTGLGIGALLHFEGRYVPISSESCHMDFGPVGAEEEAIWPHLERVFGRVTTESVMSGPGLVRLHRARHLARGEPGPALDSAGVVLGALADPAGEEARTVALFLQLIARFAGDMAITFMATGGVTLAGGILPRLLPLLDARAFRASFENKQPVARLAQAIPIWLVLQPEAVLAGMAAIGARPEVYAIDYASRMWTDGPGRSGERQA